MFRLFPLVAILIVVQVLGGAVVPAGDQNERIRAFTRPVEFDFAGWTLDAAVEKLEQAVLGTERYLDETDQSQFVRDYISLISRIQQDEYQVSILHADPDPESVSVKIDTLQRELAGLYAHRDRSAPLAEAILQAQVSFILDQEGLTSGGQPLPPLLYRSTPLPWALIVSPRDSIAQLANISLRTDETLEQNIAIENEVSGALDLSTLVVPVGGVGTYPTMVAQTSALDWLAKTISHEWTHNYLTWHPLGIMYFDSQALTTMNETTASIVGDEIGAKVIAHFYPKLVPPPVTDAPSDTAPSQPEAPVFDFRAEMYTTRVRVDELLAEGKIDEAESYMEARRLVFWEHGYAIRRLNQAYFAFYGSYAETPIGPAGEDPVGAAVRDLRARSGTLAEFLDQMAKLTSYEELQALLADSK